MTMTREQRVLNLIAGEKIDYLPSQIYFSSTATKEKLRKALGYSTHDDLDDYLDAHLYLAFAADDAPGRYRLEHDRLGQLEEAGYCRVDWDDGVVYDRWGVGIDIHSDGHCIRHHPLRGKREEALRKYKVPEANTPDVLDEPIEALRKLSGDYLVICPGYNGIFEKAWAITGFEELMLGFNLWPNLVEKFLDDITDFKIQIAEKVVAAGFKCGHTGDDFGTQNSLLMSPATWRRFVKPRLGRLWEVYKSAGLPVIHHSCGCVTELLPDMIDMGLDMLEPIQPVMDLEYLKREFGRHITFWGGIDTQDVLPFGTPEDVSSHVREVIRILGHGGGLIVAPSQEIMPDVPVENIVALVETTVAERANF